MILNIVLKLASENPNFYATCIEDFYYGKQDNVAYFYLRPRLRHELGGQRAPFFTKRGQCFFLGASGCTLKRQDMPLGCVVASGCQLGLSADKSEAPMIWGTQNGKKALCEFETFNKAQGRSVGKGSSLFGRTRKS